MGSWGGSLGEELPPCILRTMDSLIGAIIWRRRRWQDESLILERLTGWCRDGVRAAVHELVVRQEIW